MAGPEAEHPRACRPGSILLLLLFLILMPGPGNCRSSASYNTGRRYQQTGGIMLIADSIDKLQA